MPLQLRVMLYRVGEQVAAALRGAENLRSTACRQFCLAVAVFSAQRISDILFVAAASGCYGRIDDIHLLEDKTDCGWVADTLSWVVLFCVAAQRVGISDQQIANKKPLLLQRL